MKAFPVILLVFFTSLAGFAQESIEINVDDLPKNVEGVSPKNIYVSEADIIELGIYFEEFEFSTEVHFAVTDEILNFSNTNNYLIEFNRDNQLIEFGCLVPSNEPDLFRLNDKLFISVERQLDAMKSPVTQGE